MNIVIVGSSGHWHYVFESIKPDDRIVAVAPGGPDEVVDAVVAAADRHGHQPQIYADYRHALDRHEVDAVVVNPRFDRHAAVIIAALQRQLSCFSDKPFALTYDDLAAVRERRLSPCVLYPMMPLRIDPAFLAAWTAVRAGRIGHTQLITGQKSYRLGHRLAFFRHRSEMGGLIPWVGSHMVDAVHWFTAQAFTSVYATHSRAHNHSYGDLEMCAACHYTLSGGIQAQFHLDYLRPNGADSHGDDRIRIAGSDGVVEVQRSQARLLTSQGEAELELIESDGIFADFKSAVAGSPGAVCADDGFIVTEACLRARQSADDGCIVLVMGLQCSGSARVACNS